MFRSRAIEGGQLVGSAATDVYAGPHEEAPAAPTVFDVCTLAEHLKYRDSLVKRAGVLDLVVAASATYHGLAALYHLSFHPDTAKHTGAMEAAIRAAQDSANETFMRCGLLILANFVGVGGGYPRPIAAALQALSINNPRIRLAAMQLLVEISAGGETDRSMLEAMWNNVGELECALTVVQNYTAYTRVVDRDRDMSEDFLQTVVAATKSPFPGAQRAAHSVLYNLARDATLASRRGVLEACSAGGEIGAKTLIRLLGDVSVNQDVWEVVRCVARDPVHRLKVCTPTVVRRCMSRGNSGVKVMHAIASARPEIVLAHRGAVAFLIKKEGGGPALSVLASEPAGARFMLAMPEVAVYASTHRDFFRTLVTALPAELTDVENAIVVSILRKTCGGGGGGGGGGTSS